MGATLQGESAHRIAMGAETLSLRIERISKSAAGIAKFLATHPLVSKVYYPGLVAHPQHKRASTLFKSYGGLISIELIQGIDHIQFLRNLRLVICSSHLGDNRTLAIPVADTIYHEMGAQRREAMGISDSLIRFSIGMEDVSDLIADFEQALAAMKSC